MAKFQIGKFYTLGSSIFFLYKIDKTDTWPYYVLEFNFRKSALEKVSAGQYADLDEEASPAFLRLITYEYKRDAVGFAFEYFEVDNG